MVKRLSEFTPAQLEILQSKYDQPHGTLFKLLRLSDLPEKDKFNEGGIRFPLDYLRRMHIAVVLLPLEYMAEYVDIVTKEAVDDQDTAFFLTGMPTDAEFTEADANRINATSVGNLAYVYLYLNNEEVRDRCKKMLDMIYRFATNRIREIFN